MRVHSVGKLLVMILMTCPASIGFGHQMRINQDWKFLRIDDAAQFEDESFAQKDFDSSSWETVHLPHTPRVEPLVANPMWQGICWYRKTISREPAWGIPIAVEFEGAMSVADVWVNGEKVAKNHGGYLPFTIDLRKFRSSDSVTLTVRLDNRDNPQVPPGKQLRRLDFNWYGGLYRNVNLRYALSDITITDPIAANKVAGGGIFVTYPEVSTEKALVRVKVNLRNDRAQAVKAGITFGLFYSDEKGLNHTSEAVTIAPNSDADIEATLEVPKPKLWDPDHPNLYTLGCTVWENAPFFEVPLDGSITRIGIRRINFSAKDGFQINGKRKYLRGVNRHQEYPFVGYALSDNANYRDAVKIKEAGFDYVRLSHYPQSPAFLDACDELGIVVMNAIPGWQFMGDATFQERCFQNARDMIRRDRNHPSVVLWETSLNETRMSNEFVAQMNKIAHEEYPGDQMFTCGWTDEFDVFIQARQHGNTREYKSETKAAIISEYGDWEYYAQNAGLNQPGYQNLKPEERSSRQTRGAGEMRLLQQATNFQEAANENRSTPAVGDGLWVMYDYSRGYAKDLEASGPMDSLRLPKFGYYFFASQREADYPKRYGVQTGPMIRIANYWTENSPTDVRVFSNCEEVELMLNGQVVGARRKPDTDANSTKLPRPPFTFELDRFEAGTLKAIGFIDGEPVAEHVVRTPAKAEALKLRADLSGRPLVADGSDVIFVYAECIDDLRSIVPGATFPITFDVAEGDATIVGPNPAPAEAGIAGVLLRAGTRPGQIKIRAQSAGLAGGEIVVEALKPE